MLNEESRLSARYLLVLRDAILEAKNWRDVGEGAARRGVRLEDIAERFRPKIEFDPHCHTVHSDGQFSYEQLLWWCKAVGLRGVGVTDHDNVHPSIGDAIEEAEGLGVRLIPGLEMTIHRLGGQAWKGLEVGLHFFPARRFADFIRSDAAQDFNKRFEEIRRLKSEQGWGCLERANEDFIAPRGLEPISREEFWEASGCTDPVCSSSLTLVMLRKVFESGRSDLREEFPNTRVLYTYLQKHEIMPPSKARPQTFDDLAEIRRELRRHGIRSTVTLNHPEEWLSKCGLVLGDGSPDLPGIRRLVLLMLLHDPIGNPISFVELYSSRNSESSLRVFKGLFEELESFREKFMPGIAPLRALASTDSHRVTGFLDEDGEPRDWIPGEDFIFGVGSVDEAHPCGSLEVPGDYPGIDELLGLMESRAS